jgi:hypothetical protein
MQTETKRTLKIMNGNQIVDQEARLVATANGDSHAAFIVRCCNSHDDLLAALEEIAQGKGPFSRDHHQHAENCIVAMQDLARAAIKLARGEA